MPWLRLLKVSLATTTTLTSSIPAAIARSSPRSFSTSPIHDTWPRGNRSATASASAICGTSRGCTKLVASIRLAPAATSPAISFSFAGVDSTASSFCSPSRGATSTMSTVVGRVPVRDRTSFTTPPRVYK